MCALLILLKLFFLNLLPGYRQIRSIEEWCTTGRNIQEWLDANEIPISWSESGRTLVREHIKAYLTFLKEHSFLEGDIDYIVFWSSCLIPSPYTPPPTSRKSPRQGAFYISKHKANK